MNAPISSSNFDPLLPPGGGVKLTEVQPAFRPADHVCAAMENTAFFKQLPKGDADADKTLIRDTRMKVIRVVGSYLQVELDNSGEVGYVPAVMVENPSAQPASHPGSPGEMQIYPPLPGAGNATSLPAADPVGAPPDGAIPTILDPDAAAPPAAAPSAAPVPPLGPKTTTPAPTQKSKSAKNA
ncbi:MAG: hypothetical protein WCP45_08185 [Verrucomicrobiota bacterium]